MDGKLIFFSKQLSTKMTYSFPISKFVDEFGVTKVAVNEIGEGAVVSETDFT